MRQRISLCPAPGRKSGLFPGAFGIAALLCACLSAAPARAGETAPPVDPAVDAARMEKERARLLKELNATYRRVADEYIAEQPEGGIRDRVILIVGALYETGQMGDPDPVLAARYYERASAGGIYEATSALAGIYNAGAETASGKIPRDPARARQLYETAAAAGSVPAMLALGIIYADGMNVQPDPDKALGFLVQAAERGDDTAYERLEPIMDRAREWEEAKPGRKGKSGFPTSREQLRNPRLIQDFIDRTFDLDRFASHTFVELNKRIGEATKNRR